MHFPEHAYSVPQYVKDFALKVYGYKIESNSPYLNSGVLFIKDDQLAHHFFECWHKNWLISRERGFKTDQQSMAITTAQNNYVQLLDGIWNCQPSISIQYLAEAKIVHFYNAFAGNNLRNPFMGKDIYKSIKLARSVTTQMDHNIRNCRSLFLSPSLIIAGKDVTLFSSSAIVFLRYLQISHHSLFTFFSRSCSAFVKLRKTITGK